MILFAFSYDPETKKASMAGNITAREAVQVLQELLIADAVRKAKAELDKGKKGGIMSGTSGKKKGKKEVKDAG